MVYVCVCLSVRPSITLFCDHVQWCVKQNKTATSVCHKEGVFLKNAPFKIYGMKKPFVNKYLLTVVAPSAIAATLHSFLRYLKWLTVSYAVPTVQYW